MSNKRIVFSLPDGAVGIVCPSRRFLASFDTEAQGLQAIVFLDIPADAVDVEEVDVAVLPTDRTFRDAWRRPNGGPIEADMSIAREIQTKRLNVAKLKKARNLLERETLGENVALDKTKLAAIDVAAIVSGVSTPDDLKAAWPDELDV